MTNPNFNILKKAEYNVGDRVRSPLGKFEGTIKVVIPYAETTLGKGLHIVVLFDNGHIACAPGVHYTRLI